CTSDSFPTRRSSDLKLLPSPGQALHLSYSPSLALQSAHSLVPELPSINRLIPELLLNPQELVILGDAIRPAGRAGLDLAGVGRRSEEHTSELQSREN